MMEERIAVMRISGLPRRLRPAVEEAMAVSLLSEPFELIPGTDPVDWAECTRWTRSLRLSGCVDCRQVLNGTDAEFCELQQRLRGILDCAENNPSAEFEFVEQLDAVAV